MKAISADNLKLVIDMLGKKTLFEDDLIHILNYLGDDWFIEGGRFVCTAKNEIMPALLDTLQISKGEEK